MTMAGKAGRIDRVIPLQRQEAAVDRVAD